MGGGRHLTTWPRGVGLELAGRADPRGCRGHLAVHAAARRALRTGAAARSPGSAAGGGSTNDLLLFVAVSANVHAPTSTDPAAEK